MKKMNAQISTKKMVITAMFVAITAVLTFTPIGMIPLPPPLANATTVHIPVLLAALIEGPVVGLIVGFSFGVCSLIHAWGTGMIGLTLFFRNPLISILPRLLVPLIAFGIYQLLQKIDKSKRINNKVQCTIASILGSFSNTILCLGMILLIYYSELTTLVNEMAAASSINIQYIGHPAIWLISAVGLPNGISEALAAGVIVPLVKFALDKVTHRKAHKEAFPKEGSEQ